MRKRLSLGGFKEVLEILQPSFPPLGSTLGAFRWKAPCAGGSRDLLARQILSSLRDFPLAPRLASPLCRRPSPLPCRSQELLARPFPVTHIRAAQGSARRSSRLLLFQAKHGRSLDSYP